MKKGYIVCVDDDISILDSLSQQLREYYNDTHNIEVAHSAKVALKLLDDIFQAGNEVEIMFIDQVMPGMKGDELMEKISKKYPHIIRILLTGQASFSNTIDAINKGGIRKFFEKPWDTQNLIQETRILLKERKEQMEAKILLQELEKRVKNLTEKNKDLNQQLTELS